MWDHCGLSGDVPLTGYFDGDFKSEKIVWRPSTGWWYIKNSAGGWTIKHWGMNGDLPFAAT
jgi:hypothetical protein